MGNETSRAWCAKVQARLMAAMDMLWQAIEEGGDREMLRRASETVRLLGQMAATARKIAVVMPPHRAARPGGAEAGEAALAGLDAIAPGAGPGEGAGRPPRAIDRLKGGARGRL